MKRYIIEDKYRGNPMTEGKINELLNSVQEEICGEIETVLGPLSEQDTKQLLKSISKMRLKCKEMLDVPLYDGPNRPIKGRFNLPFFDQVSVGFFELNLYQIPNLLERTEVFFYFDIDQKCWAFITKPDSPVSLTYDMASSSLIVNFLKRIPLVTPWHLLQIRDVRWIER